MTESFQLAFSNKRSASQLIIDNCELSIVTPGGVA